MMLFFKKTSLIGLLISLSLLSAPVYAQFSREALCQQTGYQCLVVKPGDTWVTLWPDAAQRLNAKYVNRMNTLLHVGMTLAVPDAQQNLLELAPFDPTITPPGHPLIIIDEEKLALGAYTPQGELVQWAPISAGKDWCPDIESSCNTTKGTFAVYRKKGADCESSKYPIDEGGGAPMPYCMFFNGGIAIHGSSTVPGFNASHGCVRTFTETAQWLNEHFVTLPETGALQGDTVVIVQ